MGFGIHTLFSWCGTRLGEERPELPFRRLAQLLAQPLEQAGGQAFAGFSDDMPTKPSQTTTSTPCRTGRDPDGADEIGPGAAGNLERLLRQVVALDVLRCPR